MKRLQEARLDIKQARKQLKELGSLLKRSTELTEAREILPFFRDREALCLLFGVFNPGIARADRIAREFDLFGDFACDLAVGDWDQKAFCFVEFEDATPTSVFEPRGKKATKEWSKRFDHGYSQIIDWCWKLADRTAGDDFLGRFGSRTISYEAALIAGRDAFLDEGERVRLDWRANYVVVNSKRIHCLTFDDLVRRLELRLQAIDLAPR